MNWLSHLFLSKHDIDWKLGNLLADPLKGKSWIGASHSVKQGMALHQTIDIYTDNHSLFKKSKSLLKQDTYLRGVVIDVAYDYCLAKYWSNYSIETLDDFLDNFYTQAKQAYKNYPDTAKNFLDRLINADALRDYRNINHISQTLIRIDQRLSQRVAAKEKSSDHLPEVLANIEDIEIHFLAFFPQLMSHVQLSIGNHKPLHWR